MTVEEGYGFGGPLDKLKRLALIAYVDGVDDATLLRKMGAREPTNWSRRYKNHVEKLKSGDIYQVAEVVRNLSLRERDKHLSAGEKRLLLSARRILVSELIFAKNISEDEAENTLDEVLAAPV